MPCDPIDGRNLAPDTGTVMGVNLEWGRETLAEYSEKLGERAAVAVAFADFPLNEEDPGPLALVPRLPGLTDAERVLMLEWLARYIQTAQQR